MGSEFTRQRAPAAKDPSSSAIQRQPAPLVVNRPGDRYEQEADRVADAVVNGRGQAATFSLSAVPIARVQREDAPKEKMDEEKYKEAGDKLKDGFLATPLGKDLQERVKQDKLVKGATEAGKSFIATLPGKIITGAAAAGAVATLAAMHKALPAQIPEIPLDVLTPGLSVEITYKGPVDKPTEAMITFKFAEQAPKGGGDGERKPAVTRAEKQRAENAVVAADQAKFRAGMKYPPGSPEDLQQKADGEAARRALAKYAPGPDLDAMVKKYPWLQAPQPKSGLQLEMPKPSFGYKPASLLGDEHKLKLPGEQKKKEDEPALQRKAAGDATVDAAPPVVHDVLQSPGQPLDASTRGFMEDRFGHDFSRVRVHSGAAAEQSAREVNASAYTVGHNVVFGVGRYSPGTHEGRQLIAHELTHVVQQVSGVATGRIQAKPDRKMPAAGPKTISFKIKVDHEMDADELTHEFVKQYYHYTTEAQIQTKLSLWTNSSRRGTRPQDVAQGFVMANVTTRNQTDFETLDPKEKEAINAETDQRFWASTGYKPGQKLGTSAQDKEMAKRWMGTRNAVLTEDKQRKAIEALPKDIKDVLFAGGASASAASPDDYTQLLRIAEKLTNLSAEARKDYLNRINASTASLAALEQSIDSYIQFQAQREKQAEENETAAKPLLGMEEVYQRYRYYQLYLKNTDLGPGAAKADEDLLNAVTRDSETALLAELKPKGFNSIASFEASIEAYRVAFRTQAVNLALDVLAHYDHMLFEERKKLQQPGAAAAIVQGIGATKASALYKESREQKGIAQNLRFAHEPKETWWIEPTRKAEGAASEAHAKAEEEVKRGSGKDPLVAERGTDREKLAGLDASGAQTYLLETLEERAVEVRSARQEFKDDPDHVFTLKDLIAASQQIQGIDPNTIYGKIISDYVQDENDKHLVSAIAVGILAVALAFLVPGGGWVAAAALIANAGLSTYQAYSAYKEYEEQGRDYNLHFLSEEPSLFWVGVAIAAAALDLGVAGSALVKQSAAALKALEGPLLAFSKDGELATLVAKIEAADANKALKVALEREAKASLEASREAWKDALGMTGRANGFLGLPMPDPGMIKQGFRALYYQVKRGINTIAKLRADAKFLDAVGDITRMSGAERAELEAAFDEVKQLVKVGQAKSMDEASLLNYVDRLAINRGKPGFQAKLFEEMKAWKPLTAEQQKALNALNAQKGAVTALYEQKAAAEEELAALRARPDRTAEDMAEIRKLETELTGLDPLAHPPRTPKKGIGKIAEAEKTLADKEVEAAKSELTLYDRLRAAAPAEAAKERALKGITTDQIGALKTKSSPLQADHVVSVREISDMDGFADLPWKDQKAIVDMKENLIAMDGAANASKGDRTWRSWKQASRFYEQAAIDTMAKREADVRAVIQAKIQDSLSKLPAARP